ncbi:MAG: tetratricopeptide repeat protein, partial [Pyrinomonadaceae bacterium]
PSPAAYDNYFRAKVLLSGENKADCEAAIGLLEQAVKQESQFGAAWAALARAYNIKAFYFASPAERKQLNHDAQVAVEKALAIDPDLAEAHLARGVLLWTHTNRFQHEQAVQSYKRAISLDPKLDEAHHQLALVYLHLGLFDKARAEIAKALEINPAHTYARFRYGVIDLYRGKYDDAYAFFISTPLEKNPSLHAFQTATALFKLGRNDEADAMIDRYLREYPDDEGGVGTSVKAMLLADAGKTEESEAAITRAQEVGSEFGHFHHTAYNIASAYAMLNKPDKAIDYLQMAADDGFPCYPLFENDEVFKVARQNSRFVALVAKLKQQWERYNSTL